MAVGFFDLPPEIRNRIYELTVINEQTITLAPRMQRLQTAVIEVCRQMRAECRELYWTSNTFVFAIPFDGHYLPNWLTRLKNEFRPRLNIDVVVDRRGWR